MIKFWFHSEERKKITVKKWNFIDFGKPWPSSLKWSCIERFNYYDSVAHSNWTDVSFSYDQSIAWMAARVRAA